LEQRGVRRGDRVALFLENSIEFVAGVLAILRIGAVFMPINPLTKTDKLAYMLKDARASALLTSDLLSSVWASGLSQLPALHTALVSGAVHRVADTRAIAWPDLNRSPRRQLKETGTIDQDLASIIYTSGSTGSPKGVMLTHLNMLSAQAQ